MASGGERCRVLQWAENIDPVAVWIDHRKVPPPWAILRLIENGDASPPNLRAIGVGIRDPQVDQDSSSALDAPEGVVEIRMKEEPHFPHLGLE